MGKLRTIIKKLSISAGTLVVLGIGAELVARLAEPGPFSLLDSHPYAEHPDRGHTHKPSFAGRWDGSWYGTDSRGFRGPEHPSERVAGELRVVCLGDSCTFGKGVRELDSWPRQLEARLREALPGRTVNVFNLGVNGYAGKEYRSIFEESGVALEPDLVVIGYNLNDFENVLRSADVATFQESGARQLIPGWVRDAMSRSALYRWARSHYYHRNRRRDWERAEAFARSAAADEQDPEVWERQRGHIEGIRTAAASVGAEVAVFLFPYESQVYLEEYDRTPIVQLGNLCETLGIPFVSFEAEFRAAAHAQDPPLELFLRGDRYHPRPQGYAIAAEAVHELLESEGWLAAQAPSPND